MFLKGFPLREFTAFKCNGYSSNALKVRQEIMDAVVEAVEVMCEV